RQSSAEFRSDAIASWRASAGRRTLKVVAADLNADPETLRTWVRDADVVQSPPARRRTPSLDQTRTVQWSRCSPAGSGVLADTEVRMLRERFGGGDG
ncbi:transposase, partial [Streptomyces sp. NPDC059970]|uniref:transposase n=1 Tax=Streptomyces sp. NPDC059970 TaxID=3347019 RepID=UPI003688EAA2